MIVLTNQWPASPVACGVSWGRTWRRLTGQEAAVINQADIERLGRQIGEAARAERVVLFGSHANGRMAPDSDVDFLVVAESDLPRHKRSRELYRRIRPLRFAVDIVVYTPDEVRRGCRTPVSFVSQALREGKTVYAR